MRGLSKLPFIVQSRANAELVVRLQQDDYPVLLEGIHTTYPLFKGVLANRSVLVRLHNAEYEYYRNLALHERNFMKKMYYRREARLLRRYEGAIADKACFVAVSEQDAALYREQLQAKEVYFLPVFTNHTLATCPEGTGSYCLYHGNLEINENEEAASWLLKEVFSKIDIPLVIAGRNPSARLERLAHKYQHTCLVANPGDAELQDLITRAQVNILPSFNNTGVKLKLMNAVFNGRHCLVNTAGVAGSGLENACHIANETAFFTEKIKALYELPFTENEKEMRQGLLQRVYNNEQNAVKLLTWLH